MHKLRILILYPEPAGLALLTSMLKSLGHIIEEATTDRAAVRLMERNDVDLVLAGVDPLDNDALELLMYVRRKHREVPVILLFPRLHPERAKEALRMGAMAVLKYPVPAAELRAAVLQALERCDARAAEAAPASSAPAAPGAGPATKPAVNTPLALSAEPVAGFPRAAHAAQPAMAISANSTAHVTVGAGQGQGVEQVSREIGLLGNDPSWRQVIDLAATIAPTRTSVLIVGEPGTGKSLVARLIHSLSSHPEARVRHTRGVGDGRRAVAARVEPRDDQRPGERVVGLAQQSRAGPGRNALSRRGCCAAGRAPASPAA